MHEQRPPVPDPDEETPDGNLTDLPSSEQPTIPMARVVPPDPPEPDVQATQPLVQPVRYEAPPVPPRRTPVVGEPVAVVPGGSGRPPRPPDRGISGGWIAGGVLAFAVIVGLVALILLTRDDDDDANATATIGQATEVATATPEPAATPSEPTSTVAPEEPSATPEPPTATPEPTVTPEPPTATPEPEPTPTEESQPTATPEPEPTATVIPSEPATPVPTEGELVYEADWSGGENDWLLAEGWAALDGTLIADGNVAAPLLSPFQPESADYAVEAELSLLDVDQCATVAGVFARVTEQSNVNETFPAGYIGNVCATDWLIEAVNENNDNRDTLARGEFTLDDQPHVYRLEVEGDQIRMFVDGEFVGEATDQRWTNAGGAGIYLDGALQVTVSAFRVYALPSGG